MTLMERAPERLLAAVLCQPVGHASKTPDAMYDSGRDAWGPQLIAQRPDLTMETIEQYLHNLYRLQPDFMYSVSRDFARSCQTPMLVMPDDTPAHSYEAAIDLVELAPKAQVTVYPWKESDDIKAKTIEQVRDFLRAHQPGPSRPVESRTASWPAQEILDAASAWRGAGYGRPVPPLKPQHLRIPGYPPGTRVAGSAVVVRPMPWVSSRGMLRLSPAPAG